MAKNLKKLTIFIIVLIIIVALIFIRTILTAQNSVTNKVSKLEEVFDLSSPIFYLNDENYPDNPYDVVAIYLDGYALIYDQFIYNDEVLEILVEQQRLLLDESILKRNTLSAQKKNLFNSLELLRNSGFRMKSITLDEPYFTNDDEDESVVKVLKVDNEQEIYNFKYYVRKNSDGYWKIIGWTNDNQNYLIEI